MSKNIKIIKLVTGEQVMAEVISDSVGILKVSNPTLIVMMPPKTQSQQPSVGLAPWAEFSDDKEISIDKLHVIAIMTPIKEFIDQYNMIFSKIITPKSNLILPTQEI